MTQKTISLPEKVYNSLKKQKKKKETFSDLITRLLNESEKHSSSPDISTFHGKLEEEEGEWVRLKIPSTEIEKYLRQNQLIILMSKMPFVDTEIIKMRKQDKTDLF